MYTNNSLFVAASTLLLFSSAVFAAPAQDAKPLASQFQRRQGTPGQCGIHVTQFQKNEGPPASNGGNAGTNVDYRFNIQLFDDYQRYEAQLVLQDAPTAVPVEVTSALEYTVYVTAGEVDSDPVSFSFGPDSWDSNAGLCSVGGYDSDQREMDCGFACAV